MFLSYCVWLDFSGMLVRLVVILTGMHDENYSFERSYAGLHRV